MIWLLWPLIGLFASWIIAKFFEDGISLFGVMCCMLMGPFALVGPIVWTLANIRIF